MSKTGCEWCAKGDAPQMLDRDGVRADIAPAGTAVTLCHAYGDHWWPCTATPRHTSIDVPEEPT
jgi:hypothetical protein